jgi:hypothetical protein
VRYDALYEHFKVPLLEMENYFYLQIPPSTRDFYAVDDNLEKFRKANPDVYDAMERLAEVLGLEVLQTVTVNAITEYSTYCTSIVARNQDNEIAHVRNLDFSATSIMKQLVFEAVLVKDGEVRAQSPVIAGYYGFYTGHKPGFFSVSYNVRETVVDPSEDMILANL